MPRRDFIDAIRTIATKFGLEFKTLSHDWIIQITDPKTGKRCNIFGYTFDTNPAGAVEICKEKAATSLVLTERGVANVPHHVFLDPANECTTPYVPTGGNWVAIRALIDDIGFPVVIKPLKGSGGINVVRASCWREVEGAVQSIFGQDYGIAVSPYKNIVNEYRCFCIRGRVPLVYRKVRPHVIGDGALSVAALVAKRIEAATHGMEAQSVSRSAGAISAEDLARIPAEGEFVPLNWKHNLGQGAAIDLDVPAEMVCALSEVAIAAANAIGLHFCSSDLIDVHGEGIMVIEVNGGVMMDSFIGQLGEKGMALASELYEEAVLTALGSKL